MSSKVTYKPAFVMITNPTPELKAAGVSAHEVIEVRREFYRGEPKKFVMVGLLCLELGKHCLLVDPQSIKQSQLKKVSTNETDSQRLGGE